MLIKKIHIYGYGKLVDRAIDLTNGLHVIYGENEAGKSTIMSFIHSVLFGFPAKNHHENRYEPRNGMKYGGKIEVELIKGETLIIERIHGKSAGDVTLFFEDGTKGGEDELTDLLYGLNKRIYTSIFSFGLQGLQDIQGLNSNELNHYLFSSSVLGNDGILELENKINKDMESLFKPGGKKTSA